MKKMILTSILALTFSVALVSGVMAQQAPAPAQTAPAETSKIEKFGGVITKTDEANKDVSVQFHKDKMTFSSGENMKIKEGNKEIPFSNLKTGMWASVQYQKEGDKLMAQSMRVTMPKMVAKKETSSEATKATPPESTNTNPSSNKTETKYHHLSRHCPRVTP